MAKSSCIFTDSLSCITIIFWLVSYDPLYAESLGSQNTKPSSNITESAKKKLSGGENESLSDSQNTKENQGEEEDFEFEPEDHIEAEPTVKKEQESEEKSHAEKVLDLEREAKEAFSQDPYRSLHLSLSPGYEKIQGKGGSSSYGGSSQFLGLDLTLEISPPDWNNFSFLFSLHFHEFVTSNIVRVRSEANATSGGNLRFQRSNFSVGLQKQVFQVEAIQHLYLILGVLASQFPLLETSSQSTGATQLDSFYYTGVSAGGLYEFFWSERGRVLLNGLFLLRSFNSLKTIQRTSLALGLKYRLIPRLFLETSVRWMNETADYNLHCPDGQQVSCSSKGSLESQLTSGQLGIGFEF